MEDKLDQLEYTVMELGTEIFRLKSKVSQLSVNQQRFSKTLDSLKVIMDEKGILTEEDFELALSSEHGESSYKGSEEFDEAVDLPIDTNGAKNEFH